MQSNELYNSQQATQKELDDMRQVYAANIAVQPLANTAEFESLNADVKQAAADGSLDVAKMSHPSPF